VREVDGKQVQKAAARFLNTANLTIAVTLPAARGAAARSDQRAPRLLARLQAAVAAAGSRAPMRAAKAARGADVRNVETYRLPSGVRLLILPDDTADQVSVRAVWPGGARLEDGHLTGAASLIARLLARGTKTRAPEQLAAELADAGGHLEGFAGQDFLGVRSEFLASRWEHGLDLLIDCLRNPRFAEEDVEQDRRVALEAIRVRDTDPANVARRLFEDTVYDGRPYHEDALGTSESVSGLTRRRLLDFFRAAYGPSTLTLAIVGAVDPARVADRVQALFADAPVSAREPAVPAGASAVAPPQGKGGVAPPGEPRQVVRFGPAGQARLVLGFPGVTPGDPDRLALDVIAEALNQPGRRLAALRDGRGLLEEVEAKSTVSADGGTFAIRAAVRPDLLELAVAALRGELAQLLEAGVTADELAAARQSLAARRALSFERRGTVALALALGATMGDPARSPRRDLDDLARLKAEDVLRAARRLLDPRREVLAVVRPQQGRVSVNEIPPRPGAARGRAMPARDRADVIAGRRRK
jgi:predicted Zn-dependent peptidase